MQEMTRVSIKERFYQRNRVYYEDLHRIHSFLVPEGLRVLEIGSRLGRPSCIRKTGLRNRS